MIFLFLVPLKTEIHISNSIKFVKHYLMRWCSVVVKSSSLFSRLTKISWCHKILHRRLTLHHCRSYYLLNHFTRRIWIQSLKKNRYIQIAPRVYWITIMDEMVLQVIFRPCNVFISSFNQWKYHFLIIKKKIWYNDLELVKIM